MSQSKIKELIKHFLVYGLGSVAQSLASLFLLPILTRYLVPESFGIYTLINLSAILAGTVFYLGISSALPRSYFDYQHEDDQKQVLSTGFFLIAAGSLLQIAFVLLSGGLLSQLLFGHRGYYSDLVLMFAGTAIGSVNTFFQTYFRLLNRSITVVGLAIFNSIITVFLTLILLKLDFGIKAPIYSFLAAQILVFLVTLFFLGSSLVFKIKSHEVKLMLKFGVPTVLNSFSVMGIEWSDRFFINKYLSLSDVGTYSLAYKVGSLINAFYLVPFGQIWSPLMMKYKEDPDVKDFFSKAFYIFCLLGMVMVILTNAFIVDLVELLVKNSDYYKGLTIVPVVMLGVLLYGTANILSAGFFYQRKIMDITVIYFFVAGCNLLLNQFLIPRYGYWGATWASFLTYCLVPVLLYYRSRIYFSFDLKLKSLVPMSGMVVVAIVLTHQATNLIHKVLIAAGCLIGLYATVEQKYKNQLCQILKKYI